MTAPPALSCSGNLSRIVSITLLFPPTLSGHQKSQAAISSGSQRRLELRRMSLVQVFLLVDQSVLRVLALLQKNANDMKNIDPGSAN